MFADMILLFLIVPSCIARTFLLRHVESIIRLTDACWPSEAALVGLRPICALWLFISASVPESTSAVIAATYETQMVQ